TCPASGTAPGWRRLSRLATARRCTACASGARTSVSTRPGRARSSTPGCARPPPSRRTPDPGQPDGAAAGGLAVGGGGGVDVGSGVLPGDDGVGVGAGLDRRGLGEDGVGLGDGEAVLGVGDGVGEWVGVSGGFVACCPVCGLSWPVLPVAVVSGRTQ